MAAHDNMFMKLDCGRWVSIHAFEYIYTYGGLVLGRPNAKMSCAAHRVCGCRGDQFVGAGQDPLDPTYGRRP